MNPIPPAHPLQSSNRSVPARDGERRAEQQDSREVARDFASLFAQMLVKEMWKSASSDGRGPFGNGPGAEIYRGLAESAMADAMTDDGLAPLVDRIQELIDHTRGKEGGA